MGRTLEMVFRRLFICGVLLKQILCVAMLGVLGGCGYAFQNSTNTLYLKEGVQSVYVSPITNAAFRPGVENLVYNNLIRVISVHRKIKLVQSAEAADAILYGSVVNASYAGSFGTAVKALKPNGLGENLPQKDFNVSTIYTAFLSCSFELVNQRTKPGRKSTIWGASFNRSKTFPGSNQLDVPGTTSALINDSEFDRALVDMARSMMDDVHESMIETF